MKCTHVGCGECDREALGEASRAYVDRAREIANYVVQEGARLFSRPVVAVAFTWSQLRDIAEQAIRAYGDERAKEEHASVIDAGHSLWQDKCRELEAVCDLYVNCLRGVQGIQFEDGYEVNVADLRAVADERTALASEKERAESFRKNRDSAEAEVSRLREVLRGVAERAESTPALPRCMLSYIARLCREALKEADRESK